MSTDDVNAEKPKRDWDPFDGKRSPAQMGVEIPPNWKPTLAQPVPVARCRIIKKNGERCRRWGLRGTTRVIDMEDGTVVTGGLCYTHGGHLPNVQDHASAVIESGKLRLIGLSDRAISVLEDLMENAPENQVRLKATTEILDRSNIKGTLEVDVQVTTHASPVDRVNARLAEMAHRITADQEAEEEIIVEEDDQEETP